MKTVLLNVKSLILLLFIFSTYQLSAQLIAGHAYLKGDYVEVGINSNGQEGAPCVDTIGLHCRGGAMGLHGFVANPQMDGWDEFNGDFFTPGSPECGFGLTYKKLGDTTLYKYNNNHSFDLDSIPGSIIDFTNTTDSTTATWQGMIPGDSLQLTVLYELKKDQLFYSTTMTLDNLGSETFIDVYYYHNFDPDNNQSLSFSFVTTNTIESQSTGLPTDTCKVTATQSLPWDSEVALFAYGADWRCYYGGFSNRNGEHCWNGLGGLITTEGSTVTVDEAIGIAHKTATITPGKAGSIVFGFGTAFGDVTIGEPDPDNSGIEELSANLFSIYPNPSAGDLTIQGTGYYDYFISDLKGAIVLNGSGSQVTQIDLSSIEAGTYFVRIEQDGKQRNEKLILR